MNKVLEYRNRHPRCKYCKYFNIFSPKGLFSYIEIPECKLKDRYLHFYFSLRNFRGKFCKWFEVKGGDCTE